MISLYILDLLVVGIQSVLMNLNHNLVYIDYDNENKSRSYK